MKEPNRPAGIMEMDWITIKMLVKTYGIRLLLEVLKKVERNFQNEKK